MRTDVQPTSLSSYDTIKASGTSSYQCARILGFIAANSSIDWSIGELAHFLSMEKSTVSARLRELLDADALEAKPNRKDRRSNITVRPVGLPVMGQHELFPMTAQAAQPGLRDPARVGAPSPFSRLD